MCTSELKKDENDIHERDEMGFFILQDTTISLCGRNTSASTKRSLLSANDWVNVDVITEDLENDVQVGKKKQKIDNDGQALISSPPPEQDVETCPRCNLILHTDINEEGINRLQYRSSAKCSFNGSVQDMSFCTHHKLDSNRRHQSKRSDSALLIGNVIKCQEAGYIRIERFEVLIMGGFDDKEANNDTDDECGLNLPTKRLRDDLTITHEEIRASVVITVSLPHLERVSRMISKDESEAYHPISHYDDYLSTNSTGFPPHGRLLFSLIRSDWGWLDMAMRRLANTHNCGGNETVTKSRTPKLKSMFPDTMTLEELYARIRGASIPRVASFIEMNLEEHAHGESRSCFAGDLSLPDEVLQSKLAPYLRAKSLHSLRSTCRYMHQVLQSVVPGMKLKLFPHQVRSLHWMRKREESPMTEDDAMISGPNNVGIDEVLSGDLYRSITSGGIISVTNRRRRGLQRRFFQINTWTGTCSKHTNDRIRTVARCRNAARGGLLCDDPGLGKTITILSLVLQTFGQSTERTERKDTTKVSEDLIIDAYWRELLVSYTRRDQLMGLTLKLRKYDMEQFFQYPVKNVLNEDEWVNYRKVVKTPTCMEDIIGKIRNDAYDESLDDFTRDIKILYNNAKLYNSKDTVIYSRAEACLNKFEECYNDFRLAQLNSAMGKQKRSKLSLGSLISENKRQELLDTLLPSKGTLIVVPSTLMQHWEEQMKMHIDFTSCSKREPLIFRHRPSRKYRRELPVKEISDYNMAIELCQDTKSHFPFLFIDECTDKLPSEDFMSIFHIVLTTTKRLTMEWKNGSFEEELQKGETLSYRSFNYDMFNEYKHVSPCSLLKINWLRLVVDEGHSMGKRGAPSNSMDFASWITAERRWVMSGTPTPQTVAKSGLGNLFGLFKFLNHDYFCTPHWGEERCRALDRGLKRGHLASFFNLRQLLNLFMVRHTKADVEQLHKPVFTLIHTNMTTPEKMAYNTLVTAVQMNLVTTSMEGKTSGKQDSLLNARQGKHAKQALGNIRLACSGGTKVVPTLTTKNWIETTDLMQLQHGADKIKNTLVENFLHRMTTEQLSSCMCCGLQLQTLFLLPCGCQICTECVTPNTSSCLACHAEFDADDFQRLQPGLDYTWKWNIIEAQKEREQARMLAEALEATHQREDGNQNAQQEGNNPAALRGEIINRGRRRMRKNQPHVCEYSSVYLDGKCKLCGELHLCTLIGTRQCVVCNCEAEDCPEEESKAYYIANKLINLLSVYQNRGTHEITGDAKRPLKVIIFTQFQQVSNLVGDRLIRRFGRGCVAEYWGQTRNLELARFTKSTDCFCMLLNKDGSHGLNLSFVTHIFFLDEILDKSLESQVIARAYRMGATENVYVEQLVARHSIEELIVEMNKRDNPDATLHNTSNSDHDKRLNNPQAKTIGFLLSNVKLIRPPKMTAPFADLKQPKKTQKRSVKFAL